MPVVRISHIGGPTTLIEAVGWRILTDPTFDRPGRRYRFGWGTSSRKIAGPAIAADALGPIDAILLTHDHHADNLDDAGRSLLPQARTVLTTQSGAGRLGGSVQGMGDWDVTRLERAGYPAISVTATPCRHGPAGSRPVVGDVIGFALEWEGQEHGALWVSGDTVLYDGVREVATRLDVGTAIVHLGRVRFPITGRVKYTMDVDDAIELCRAIDPRTIIPVHYEGWSHFTQARQAATERLSQVPGDIARRVVWLPLGQAIDVTV